VRSRTPFRWLHCISRLVARCAAYRDTAIQLLSDEKRTLRRHPEVSRLTQTAPEIDCRPGDERRPSRASHSAAMQRANLVARWIPKVGKIELACGAFAPAGRVLDALAAIGYAGVVERPRLLRAGARETDGTAIGVRRRLAVDRLGDAEHAGLRAIKDAALRIRLARRQPDGAKSYCVRILDVLS
jgi:hypothetical protein